jgi:hypothetical protein
MHSIKSSWIKALHSIPSVPIPGMNPSHRLSLVTVPPQLILYILEDVLGWRTVSHSQISTRNEMELTGDKSIGVFVGDVDVKSLSSTINQTVSNEERMSGYAYLQERSSQRRDASFVELQMLFQPGRVRHLHLHQLLD